MKKVLTLLLPILLLALTTRVALAEETTETDVTTKYNITFPIEALGGCTDLKDCKAYCSESANADACIAYAKEKGFYNRDKAIQKRKEFVEKAKEALGCSTEESCKALCSSEENRDKCHAYAAKYGKIKFQLLKERKEQFIEKAKEALGCDSAESCKDACSKEENKDKCQKARQNIQEKRKEIQELKSMSREEKCAKYPEECKRQQEKMQELLKNKDEMKKRLLEEKKRMQEERRKNDDDVKGTSTGPSLLDRILNLFN